MFKVVADMMLNKPNAYTLDTPTFITGEGLDDSFPMKTPKDYMNTVKLREINRHIVLLHDTPKHLILLDNKIKRNAGTTKGIEKKDLRKARKLIREKIKSFGF